MKPTEDLRRELGFWTALTIGAGTMIGAGIFLLAGVAVDLTGPGAIFSYLVVIGASSEFRIRNVLFGSIPDVVADQAPCSVLMVRRYMPEHWSVAVGEKVKRIRERLRLTSSPDTGPAPPP